MSVSFDVWADGERERQLMQRVRRNGEPVESLLDAVPAFPIKLQIQTLSPCNAACVMCPWPATKNEMPQGIMDDSTFAAVVEQMAGRGVERVGLFLMNEPTLDRRLERFTTLIKERDSRVKVLIYTNGVLLTGKRAESLARAGMDEVDISVLGFDRENFEKNMHGAPFDDVMRNIGEIDRLVQRGATGRMNVRIVTLNVPGAESGLAEFRRRHTLSVHVKPVTNRAGSVDVDALGMAPDTTSEFAACQRPFVKAYILYNGDVVLCNCDWRRTTILGNVREETLESIWNGPRLRSIRRQHVTQTLDPAGLCAKCDYPRLPRRDYQYAYFALPAGALPPELRRRARNRGLDGIRGA